MTEHVWAQENIAAYVIGGLTAEEGERFDGHLAECPVCALAVEEATSLEGRLAPLFVAANPGPALEDRIIHGLPSTPPPRATLRLSRRGKVGAAAAAVVLIAAMGAGLSSLIERSTLRFPA